MYLYEFRILSISVGRDNGILMVISFDAWTRFSRAAIFTILILLIHEHGRIFQLVLSLNFFLKDFAIFIVDTFLFLN
jgi:hypothetical protein